MLQTKKLKLNELCVIQGGLTARERLRPVGGGGVRAVQLRDLREDEPFDPSNARSYALKGTLDRYNASAGDLLFRSRGDHSTAVVVEPEARERAVAISPLIILRPKRDLVDPSFLAWFINQSWAQRHFNEGAQGSSLRMIPRPCLESLEVPVPDLPTQKQIVALDSLAQRERKLMAELADKRARLTGEILLRHAAFISTSCEQESGRSAHQSASQKDRRRD